ncbi:MAG: thiamine pyrophosphate-binding protein [Fimbriimonadaceae bacterium]
MPIKVSDYIADWLHSKGIGHIFGIVGAGNAHIFDSVYAAGRTEIVCVHHEQAGVMAAQTYFRTCGTVTVTLLTTGAGSTNAITGVVGAWADSIPCLMLSGNENSKYTTDENPLRMWGVQGYDSTAMVSRVCKFAERVMDPLDVGAALEVAYQISTSDRPGPCWVDIPMNIQSALVDGDVLEARRLAAIERLGVMSLTDQVVDESAAYILDKIAAAERPLLWLGHGIRLAGRVDLVQPFVEKAQTPAIVSWAGIDMIDSDHPLVFGRAGVYGNRQSNFILQNADLVVAIGTRLAIPQVGYEVSELARAAKFIVVDIDPHEARKLDQRLDRAIACDAGELLDSLLCRLEHGALPAKPAWIAQCEGYRNKYPVAGPQDSDVEGYLNSYRFMDRLVKYLKDDQIVVTDMGTALLSGHQVLRFKGAQRLMTSTGLGEMGFGLPGAVGASFARNRGEVLCLNCDGGMMMNLQEMQTVSHHQLPIKLVVFNNDGYLMIKHTQKSLFKGKFSGTDKKSGVTCPDFERVAAAFGFPYVSVRTWEDFEHAIPTMQANQGPIVCEVFMHPEQLFYPKLSLAARDDGSLVSPPLEDLSPLLPLEEIEAAMKIGVHPKSVALTR